MKRLMFAAVLAAFMAGFGSAQRLNTRGDLNAILGTSTLDDFETYRIADGSADNMGTFTLNSASLVNGQGPGLVNPGASYMDPSQAQLQWNGNQYFALNTKTILSNGTTGEIDILYSSFTQAFGVDLQNFSGFPYDATVDVFNGNSMVGTFNLSLSGGGGETMFAGWRNDGGITAAKIHSANYPWSPIIDNSQYGTTVPEPTTLAVLGIGALVLLRRRKK